MRQTLTCLLILGILFYANSKEDSYGGVLDRDERASFDTDVSNTLAKSA